MKGPDLPPFHVMMKPRGAICNLDCAYCYYLAKEELYPGSAFRMSDAVLERFTKDYLRCQPVPEAVFGWQGGEPLLMGLEFFERAVEVQRRHAPPGMRVVNTLQTNGILLDDGWCRFLAANDFLVGISLDGPRHLHDPFRVDKGGRPTFDKVMRGVELLRRHGVEFNVLTTVHAVNAGAPLDVYRFLRDEVGTAFIQFIPIVERREAERRKRHAEAPAPADARGGSGWAGRKEAVRSSPGASGRGGSGPAEEGSVASSRSVTGAAYGAFLNAVFDEWVCRDVGKVFVQIFDVTLASWVGRPPGLCVFSPTCGTALALEHNGDLYACDHFVDPAHRLGNVLRAGLGELVRSEKQVEFGKAKRDGLPGFCRRCEVRFLCHGGCPKDRLLETPDGERGLNYLCEGYKSFFLHTAPAMRFMAEALHRRQPPASIMERFGPAHYGSGRRKERP